MNQMAENRMTGDRTDRTDRSGQAAGAPSSAMATEQSQTRDVSAQDVGNEARQVASQVADQARELVSGQMSRRAERSAGDIRSVAEALRQTNKQLEGNMAAPLVEKAADQLERLSQYLRTASAQDVVRSAERFARREPLLFLGGAFALGILSARFLKSSAQHTGMTGGAGTASWDDSGRDTRSGSRETGIGTRNAGIRESGTGTWNTETDITATGPGVGSGVSTAGAGTTVGRAASGNEPAGRRDEISSQPGATGRTS